jgi:hypothetical protein
MINLSGRSQLLLFAVSLAVIVASLLVLVSGCSRVTSSERQASQQGAISLPGLLGHWSFDESSGDQALDSAGGNSGTLHNSPARVGGELGSALSFNGSNQYVEMGSPGPLGGSAVSVAAWLKTTNTAEEVFFAYGSDSGNGSAEYFRLNVNMGGGDRIGTRSADGRRSFYAPGITDGAWHHVVVQTAAGDVLTNLQVYLDGALLTSAAEDSNPSAGWNIGSGSPTIPVTVGADVQGGFASFPFGGSIDDVQLYNRVLSASEVSMLAGTSGTGSGHLARLQISANHRYFQTSTGAPFVWMGDTVWALPKLSAADIETYLTDAAAKRFNIIQVELDHYYWAFNPPNPPSQNPYLSDDTDTPNETFWSSVDSLVTQADAHGIYVALVVGWPYHLPYVNNTLTKIDSFGRWLGARYGSRNNVVWFIAGEYSANYGYCPMCIPQSEKDKFDHMALAIRAGGGTQLMTIHPGNHSSLPDFDSSIWLDFTVQQSGHASDNHARLTGPVPETYELIGNDYANATARPTLDAEINYEGVGDLSQPQTGLPGGPVITPADVRRKAYWSVFAGGAGVTYGHVALEVLHKAGETGDYWGTYSDGTPVGLLLMSWQQALSATGRSQMQYLRALLESKPIFGRVPDQSLILSAVGTGLYHAQATRDSSGSYAWVYVPDGRPISIDLSKLSGPQVNASWFDPQTGSSTSIGQYAAAGAQTFDAPGATADGNDWVLALESAGTTMGSGPLGHWSFDELSGDRALDSAGANPGTLYNSPARVGGRRGGALSFNGSNQYVQMGSPGPLGASAVAVSVWLETTSAVEEVFFAYGSDSGNGSPEYFRLNVNMNGVDRIGARTADGRRSFYAPGITDGAWHHVVVQTAADDTLTDLQFYMDGALLTSSAEDGNPSALWSIGSGTPTIPVTVGADVQGGGVSFPFGGSIDDVQLFNRSLTPSEISILSSGG